MERDGVAVTCDGRLFDRRAAVTGNALSRQWTDEYVERVAIWDQLLFQYSV